MLKNEEIVMIDIINWDKHQFEVGRIHRRWLAMSTEMLSDPAIRALPPAAFKCWVGLLLHGGKVGVPFKFSASLGKDLFGLRHSPDFSLFVNHGLITLSQPTRQDKTGQDKTGHKKKKPVRKKQPAKIVDATKAETIEPAKPEVRKGWGDTPDGVCVTAWAEWAEYKGGQPKQISITKCRNILIKYPFEVQRQMIDASVAAGWLGIFPPRNSAAKSRTNSNHDAARSFADG